MTDPKAGDSEYSWKRDPLLWAYSVLMSLPLILVFFFYNHYQLGFLVYCGWLLIGFGLILVFLAGAEFRRHGGSPPGESIVKTTNLVDSGIYGVVRNPQYLGFILLVIGVVSISQHWFVVFCGLAGSVLFYRDIFNEEQNNLQKFGDDYRRYMERVPRMNLFLGIIRILRRRS